MQGKGEQFNNAQNNAFFKEKKLPQVRFEPTTLCFIGMSTLPTELSGQHSNLQCMHAEG